MENFEFKSELSDGDYNEDSLSKNEFDYSIVLINNEIKEQKKIKENLTRFAYLENNNLRLIFLDFKYIIEEIVRLTNYIDSLEKTKLEFFKLKEKHK
jgi:hypothetical protein